MTPEREQFLREAKKPDCNLPQCGASARVTG
jgi:hypothetical protein